MSSPTPPKKQELSSEVRMVIAFVLMGLILVVTPWAYRRLGITPPQPAPTPTKASLPKTPNAPVTASGTPVHMADLADAGKSAAEPAPAAVTAAAEQEQVVDTALYHVVFSNRGAVVKSWTLKNYKDSVGKPLELVNQPGASKVGFPFSLDFRGEGNKQPSTDLNNALWVAHPGAGGLSIQYEFSDGRTTATKTFAFQRDAYMVQYSDDVALGGNGLSHLVQWRGGFGDMAVQNASGLQGTIHYDTEKGKLIRSAAKSAKNGPVDADGTFSFAGIDDQYFAAAFLPSANTSLQTTTFDDTVPSPFNTANDAYPGVAVGGASRNQLALYVGPKEVSLLHQVNSKLDGIVDWGFFGIIAKPLFQVLHWMNDAFVHNYGWSIILLTIFLNVAQFPLKIANLKSMRKMQVLQPEIKAINDRYKGVGMSDPKAANKQQEIMDLYKKHGVNPMGGCIPLLIQMPFLYAFYKVLGVSIEMRHATWLWVGDLSQPEHLAIRMLPLLLIVTGYLLQRMTPQPATAGDNSQQKMMQFMPLIWGFFFWNMSTGVVLYWLTNNMVGMGQQWFFNKTAGPVEAAAAAKKLAPKNGRKKA
jgi:YidC/Oxa1 family membrane protein insertase